MLQFPSAASEKDHDCQRLLKRIDLADPEYVLSYMYFDMEPLLSFIGIKECADGKAGSLDIGNGTGRQFHAQAVPLHN